MNNKYTWAWKDDSTTHTNTANSLEEIIEEIVGYYYEGEITGFELTVEGELFSLFFEINEDDAYQYEIEITPHAVGEFLDQLAEQCNRNDCFDIQTNY